MTIRDVTSSAQAAAASLQVAGLGIELLRRSAGRAGSSGDSSSGRGGGGGGSCKKARARGAAARAEEAPCCGAREVAQAVADMCKAAAARLQSQEIHHENSAGAMQFGPESLMHAAVHDPQRRLQRLLAAGLACAVRAAAQAAPRASERRAAAAREAASAAGALLAALGLPDCPGQDLWRDSFAAVLLGVFYLCRGYSAAQSGPLPGGGSPPGAGGGSGPGLGLAGSPDAGGSGPGLRLASERVYVLPPDACGPLARSLLHVGALLGPDNNCQGALLGTARVAISLTD